MWPDTRIQKLLGIELPIIQAPMAGPVFSEMVIAVCKAGGLGSLPCAMLTPERLASEIRLIREKTSRPINLNFFCHPEPKADAQRQAAWMKHLEKYYLELAVDPPTSTGGASRRPFDDATFDTISKFRPEVVSFHFGLPEARLLDRVKSMGSKVLSSATTVAEARWLESHGCDAIIAQGFEAGGHRGMFLSSDISTQVGTISLVPQIVDAVKVPVIAAGGIADARTIAAAFALGAAAVQIGTAFLFCPEAKLSPAHRQALANAADDTTTITNVFTGRPARGVINRLIREAGPLSPLAPEFPLAASEVSPLRAKAEQNGSADFSPLWAGQSVRMNHPMGAGELTALLAAQALEKLGLLSKSR
jgi:nitronate monooxygenase